MRVDAYTNLLHDTLHQVELVASDDDLLALVQRTQRSKLWLDPRAEPTKSTLSK